MTVRIIQGDCVEVMRTLEANSIDAVVTDPPYGIRFMGKAWDGADIEARTEARRACPSRHDASGENGAGRSVAAEAGKYDLAPKAMRAFQEFSEEWAREALRVLKPGGYLLSFSSPRTYHRMTSGIEDAGFEIRDQIMWIFGSGFPKSHNGEWGGTAAKPAHEPIVVARKPLEGTVEQNWRKWGTGALNIDGCRVGDSKSVPASASKTANKIYGAGMTSASGGTDDTGFNPNIGRWPANVIHDGSDEVLAGFPHTTSGVKFGGQYGRASGVHEGGQRLDGTACYGDAGSAARFFYCAKTSKRDRNEGLEGLEGRRTDDGRQVPSDNAYQRGKTDRQNHHPTVKPTDLMRYLCRLVTPAGGVVLDPFTGSGSTLKAAVLEGFDAIGIELSDEYVAIAQRRVDHAFQQVAEEAAARAEEAARPVTLDLFAEVT